jgi:hypothetical protein
MKSFGWSGWVGSLVNKIVLNLTGMILAVLSLILSVPVLFLIEVLGVGHSGLEIVSKRMKIAGVR